MSDIYQVSHLFRYNQNTGDVFKRKNPDTPCRTLRKRGKLTYYQTSFKSKTYLVHRIAFLLHYGYLPSVIDHINGNGTDNRVCNLRSADMSLNSQNRTISIKSRSGVKGVLYRSKRNDYQITCGDRYIGYAKTLFDAACIRKSHELKTNFKDRK